MPRLLVVDDDPFVLKTLLRILESAGFEVLTAKNGPAAIRIMQSAQPVIDLLVSDIWMPEMDGKALAAIVELSYPEMPILFISGGFHTLAVDIGKPQLFLPKPFTRGVLLGAVYRLLYGESAEWAEKKSQASFVM